MTKQYRVGIIGFAHMHINNVAGLFAAHPQVRWAACADTVPAVAELREGPYTRTWNRRNVMEKFGLPRAYDDYREMLAKETFDLIVVNCENARHAEVVEACAAAGVHVCVEKPMAASLAEALRMVRACRAAGTTLAINWPLTWRVGARRMKALVDEGAVGRVLEIRYRAAHSGPLGPGAAHQGVDATAAPLSGVERGATWWHQTAAGGGAMLDFCCYGAMFALWLLGRPARAALGMRANLNSPWGDADDNAIMLLRFDDAMGVFDGGWIAHGLDVAGPTVRGTEGTLLAEWQGNEFEVLLRQSDGQVRRCDGESLPAGRASIAEELIFHFETGEPLHPTITADFNLQAMAMLDAAVRSADSGKMELVDNQTWKIG